jgi:glutamine phosphoribosylpyrophosphate amidotransferase
MCAIVGFESENVTEKDLDILKKVLIESKIRGKHASGIAWFNGEKICCEKKPMPMDRFLKEFDLEKIVHNGKVKMIAHARYSTSDLEFNQPLISGNLAIAHNGVVTQEAPENWEKLFGYKCETKNDSELLLRAIENGDDIFEKFPSSSIAIVMLNRAGVIGKRNGKRPLCKGYIGEGKIFASTFDILKRAGVKDISQVESIGKDLQKRRLI